MLSSYPSSVLLDTNILLRLVTAANPLHSFATSAVGCLMDANVTIYICPQYMHEFRQVATRPLSANGFGWSSQQTVMTMHRIETDFVLLPETSNIYPAWCRIVETVEAIGRANFDARIVAIAEVNHINAVLTFESSAFTRYGDVSGVTILDPTSIQHI